MEIFEILEISGKVILKNFFKSLWKSFGIFRNLWNSMGILGNLWQSLAALEIFKKNL